MHDKEDAFRIQKVVGGDGVVRFIVYFSGTDSAYDDLMSGGENVPASFGISTRTREHLESLIAGHTKDHPDAEIMLVGHSQGGMYAEAIAASGQFNVKEVLTVGAPGVPVLGGYGGANVTRLQHSSDAVVFGTEAARLKVLGPGGYLLNNLGTQGGLDLSGEVATFVSGRPNEGLSAHTLDEGDYNWLADQYEKSSDASIVAARERQSPFLNGTIVLDSDAARLPSHLERPSNLA